MSTTTTPSTNAKSTAARPMPPIRYQSSVVVGRRRRRKGEGEGDEKQQREALLDLSDLDESITKSEERRERAFDLSRRISTCIARRRFLLERGSNDNEGANGGDVVVVVDDDDDDDELESLMSQVLQREGGCDDGSDDNKGEGTITSNNRAPREGNLSYRVEEYIRLKAYLHFLETGALLPPLSHVPAVVTDEEYLAGACIGLTRDLERYGIGRATVRDAQSVRMARDLVSDIADQLVLFDFRNGPLRRKYDGVKYALRTLETVLYELSVTGTSLCDEGSVDEKGQGGDASASVEPDLKRMKVDKSNADADAMDDMDEDDKDQGANVDATEHESDEVKDKRIPVGQIKSLRLRMEHRDELRERLIKRCRDGQKMAKQSIYALHRGDFRRARTLLEQCERCISDDLVPIVTEEPGLKYGSFANVMEEYAEAKLFLAWLVGEEGNDATTTSSKMNRDNDDHDHDHDRNGDKKKRPMATNKPSCVILHPQSFAPPTIPFKLDPSVYLGGLCDLTGEVGRYAVQRGTNRDVDGVRLCLETNASILHALEMMRRLPSNGDGGGIGKKMGPLRQSVEKLERMLYEMSLVEATGGKRNVAVESGSVERNSYEGGEDNEE